MIGKELGQYKILAEIGRGGMGIVYKAYQTSLNREVALKVLPPNLANDENLVKRFHREAEAAARLSHPNIVQIFDINEISGIHFFAMEYLRGETLTQKIEREGPLSLKEAARITMMVADALNYSHSEGIVHRDIKPGNIMIDPHGHIKVTDFGLARAIESSRLTMTGTIIGTPEYMSPEQARGENLDGRSDLYSLGTVLYEMLTAKLPFEATTPFAVAQKQIYEPLPSPRSIRSEIPPALEAIILKATQKAPQDRYQKGEELKNDLELFISGKDLERITPTVTVPPEAPPVKKKISWGRIALVIVVLIAVISFLPRIKPRPSPKIGVKPEIIPPSAPQKMSEEEAKKIIEEARHLLDRGVYSEAVSKLEELQKKFPDHSQANLIPQWIKEIQDREAGKRFNEAQGLVDQGETVQALLTLNEIAKDYPGTKWETKVREKVAELEKDLKEREAQKQFLEAQDLERQNKFIEATQCYQSIINRYPGTSWAQKSEEGIAKLKDRQEGFREKGIIPEKMPQKEVYPQREGPPRETSLPMEESRPRVKPPFLKEVEKLVGAMKNNDPNIEKLISRGDQQRLAEYLWLRHEFELEKIAAAIKIPEGRIARPFAYRIAHYLMNPDETQEKDFRGPRDMESRREPGERGDGERSPRPEDKCYNKFRDLVKSDKRVATYIERGEAESLTTYVLRNYGDELKKMSQEMARPLKDLAWEFSDRLVYEEREQR